MQRRARRWSIAAGVTGDPFPKGSELIMGKGNHSQKNDKKNKKQKKDAKKPDVKSALKKG